MIVEKMILNAERNVSLIAYIQDVEGEFGFALRPAMLVLPGGGYAMCSDREADPVAFAYAKAGYQIFVLRYTVGEKCVWPLPLEDYEQAMSLIEDNAAKWHIAKDKIAVVGFSAGGHLASCAATVANHKPAAAVLVYPAILADILDLCKPNLPHPNELVNSYTCPCFLAAARDDQLVDIKNALMMEVALAEHGVPFESHIYAYGGHGFSTAEAWINLTDVSERLPNWVENSISWLAELFGELTPKGFNEPKHLDNRNSNYAPVLSISCTIGHLLAQPASTQMVLQPFKDQVKAFAETKEYSEDLLWKIVKDATLKEVLGTLGYSKRAIDHFDRQLHEIKNQIEI